MKTASRMKGTHPVPETAADLTVTGIEVFVNFKICRAV